MLRKDLNIRDPFVLPCPEENCYYLYGSTSMNAGPHLEVFRSADLEEFTGPISLFTPPPDFPWPKLFWAPEVKFHDGKYYLTVTMAAEGQPKGTLILASTSPAGPFTLHSDGPVTPRDWESLDGTLYFDGQNVPWMVFCHEWVQIDDGSVELIQLSQDLTHAVSQPVTLFHASDGPWVKPLKPGKYVTDGPFVYQDDTQGLSLLWSSFNENGYAIGIAHSPSGQLQGPWIHEAKPVYDLEGGHAMLFDALDGKRMISFHGPNFGPLERAVFKEWK